MYQPPSLRLPTWLPSHPLFTASPLLASVCVGGGLSLPLGRHVAEALEAVAWRLLGSRNVTRAERAVGALLVFALDLVTILPLAEPHFIACCHAFLTARLASSPDTPLMMLKASEIAAWKMHVEAWNLFVACDNSIRFGISPLLDERTPYPTSALMYDDDDFVVVRDLTPTLWIPLRRTHAAV